MPTAANAPRRTPRETDVTTESAEQAEKRKKYGSAAGDTGGTGKDVMLATEMSSPGRIGVMWREVERRILMKQIVFALIAFLRVLRALHGCS
ncbi:MAG: hypothetical protein AMJ69_11235 [Gammaproteobacteria bacterium SG8_47]|nr:MAG: hypothetical protein AMJ69_11235 [Gammaproteobacteria bacterium SG8_47]